MTELEKLRAALDVAALAADYDTISDAYAAYLAAYPDARVAYSAFLAAQEQETPNE
jgi:hypothetical protein